MSSHHFVREGQEPALLIIEPLSLELIEPLLEWAPVILVLDSAIDEVIKWKIKIDVVIANGNFDTSMDEKLTDQGPVKIIHSISTGDVVRATVDFLMSERHTAVNLIVNATTAVYDQWLEKIDVLDIVILTAEMKWSAIASGFEKWFPEGILVFIRSSHEESMTIIGLQKENIPNRFRTERDGVVRIKSSTPFWIGEPL